MNDANELHWRRREEVNRRHRLRSYAFAAALDPHAREYPSFERARCGFVEGGGDIVTVRARRAYSFILHSLLSPSRRLHSLLRQISTMTPPPGATTHGARNARLDAIQLLRLVAMLQRVNAQRASAPAAQQRIAQTDCTASCNDNRWEHVASSRHREKDDLQASYAVQLPYLREERVADVVHRASEYAPHVLQASTFVCILR